MQRWVIGWPTVSLRQLPGHSPLQQRAPGWPKDPFLDTQVPCGDTVRVLTWHGSWARVAVPSQPRYLQGWAPYTGWVPTESLFKTTAQCVGVVSRPLPVFDRPFGQTLRWLGIGSRVLGSSHRQSPDWIELPSGEVCRRRDLTQGSHLDLESFCRQWEGTPYLWGGTSSFQPDRVDYRTGVDCSGLVWLLARHQGRLVPRDAHDQWRFCESLATQADLQPGDLVFFSDQDVSSRIHHVMIYLRDDTLIEAAGSTGHVHLSHLAARCRTQPHTQSGEWTGQFRVWFGRLPAISLSTGLFLKQRDSCLN
jgi:hypothetical protein